MHVATRVHRCVLRVPSAWAKKPPRFILSHLSHANIKLEAKQSKKSLDEGADRTLYARSKIKVEVKFMVHSKA